VVAHHKRPKLPNTFVRTLKWVYVYMHISKKKSKFGKRQLGGQDNLGERTNLGNCFCRCIRSTATATHCNTLQHRKLHLRMHSEYSDCNTLQLIATHGMVAHCNTLQQRNLHLRMHSKYSDCNTLQHTATHYNKLQQTATHCNTGICRCGCIQTTLTATHCNSLQLTATHCNT